MTAQAGFEPHVTTLGQGTVKSLALHCTLAHGGAWKGVAASLADRVTLTAPDMASHGRSADWDGDSSFGDTVYESALSQLPEPMHVIGHSFGGAIGLRLALDHPELVRSLTMFEPVFFHIASLDAPDSLREHDAIAGPFFEAIESGDLETGARLFNRMWSEPGRLKWDEMPEQMRAAMIRAIPVVPDTDGFLYCDDQNMLPRLGALRVPTLVLHGALSLGIIGATCSGLVSRIPGAREHVFADTGHMGPISNPREVARVWGEFLNSS